MINDSAKKIFNLISEDNVAAAQTEIKQELTNRLSSLLDAKFEEFASTIFESKHKKKEKMADKDYDGDGKVESAKDEVWGSRKKAANAEGRWLKEETYCEDGECEEKEDSEEMEDSEDVEESEEQYEEEEESKSDKKGGKKSKKMDEEDEEEED